jgi:hypothetical protein
MFYFALGEKTFRDNMEKIYGEAFMVMMDPKDIPDLYYKIFIEKAQLELKLKEYKEAEPDLELAIYLMGKLPPDLSQYIISRGPDYLGKFINDPQKLLEGTAMPRVGLNQESQEQVIKYLGRNWSF